MAPCNTISTVASSGMGSSGFISAIRRFEASLRGAAQKGWFFNKTSSFYPLFKKLHRVGSGQWAVGSGQWAVGSGQHPGTAVLIQDCSCIPGTPVTAVRLQSERADPVLQSRLPHISLWTAVQDAAHSMLPTRCCPLGKKSLFAIFTAVPTAHCPLRFYKL
jgi:hypothetical protein